MEIASTGMRVMGAVVDIVIWLIIMTVLNLAIGQQLESGIGFSFEGVPALISLVLGLAYFIVPEALWGGTPAKFMLGMRVVSEADGSKIDWVKSIVRNLVRIVDALPALYLVGFLVALYSPKNQRLGDQVAKTIVVRV